MNIPYNISVHDGLINKSMQEKIWEYLQVQEWHTAWRPEPREFFKFSPSADPRTWLMPLVHTRESVMHRTVFSSDEPGLMKDHLPVYLLWKEINRRLDNQFELTGEPEYMQEPVNDQAPGTIDANLAPGWRCYANGVHNSDIMGPGYIHRDTINLADANSITMLYVANLEWYPSWAAEIRYYPNDPDGSTGDCQQFNTKGQQQRGFNIGWLDYGRIVSPVPGRVIVYDGRCLHATGASRTPLAYPSIKIAFRARLKNTGNTN
jgi:hypothetical protein